MSQQFATAAFEINGFLRFRDLELVFGVFVLGVLVFVLRFRGFVYSLLVLLFAIVFAQPQVSSVLVILRL